MNDLVIHRHWSRSEAKQFCLGAVALTLMALAIVAFAILSMMRTVLQVVGVSFHETPDFLPSDTIYVRVLQSDGRRLLWGGKDDADHFDITEFRLNIDQLKYGLGREWFPALIEPQFITIEQAYSSFRDPARVLADSVNGNSCIYPLDTLMTHEVVNDVIGGVPVFAAYCYLANLGAIYDRGYGEHVLTFAVSGYTYHDPDVWDGLNAFVLWDRETESLWWPPLGRAVSGTLMDAPLKQLDTTLWMQSTWGEACSRFPEAMVLKPNVKFVASSSWVRLELNSEDISELSSTSASRPHNPIAPRWKPFAEAHSTIPATPKLPQYDPDTIRTFKRDSRILLWG